MSWGLGFGVRGLGSGFGAWVLGLRGAGASGCSPRKPSHLSVSGPGAADCPSP